MKRKLLLYALFLLALLQQRAQAQSSLSGINYQAVARNTNGTILSNQSLQVRFTVLSGSPAGNVQYQETQDVTTNQLGLFTLQIGKGSPVSGTFAAIPWAQANQYLRVEVSTGGSNFSELGTSQLMSVPFAMFAANSGTPGPAGPKGDQGPVGPVGATGPAGPKGDPGMTGPVGPVGPMGVTGPQGVAGPIGPIGPTGATGATGPIGATGPQGAVGPIGPIGPTGATGAMGAVGPMGPTGPMGLPGAVGATGPVGPAGPIGATGPIGPQGAIGMTGPAGPQGPQGPAGPAGSISASPAGGDLSGNYPNPTVAKLQGNPVATTAPTAGQILSFDGTNWVPAPNTGGITIPYAGTFNLPGTLFSLTNNGDGTQLEGIANSTSASIASIRGTIASTTPGGFATAVRGINNGTGGLGIGVWGSQNGSGWGVYGTAVTGLGVYGNSTGAGTGVYANSIGGTGLYATSTTGMPANFAISNNSNTNNVLTITTSGGGAGIQLSASGGGNGINATSTGGSGVNATSNILSGAGVLGHHTLGGEAVTGLTTSTSGNPTGAVVGRNDGPGYGVQGFVATDASGNGVGVLGRVGVGGSTGMAGKFENLNTTNNVSTVVVTTAGGGNGVDATGNGGFAVHGTANNISGGGVVGDNTAGGEAVTGRGNSASGIGAVVGRNDGGGYGVYGFIASNTSGTSAAVAGRVGISGSKGRAGFFENTNNTNTNNTVEVVNVGPGVIADHSQGNAGNFFMNNTSGVGAGVRGEVNSIFGNNGTAGVYGVASGTGGYGGYFEHTSTTGFGRALYVTSQGQGTATELNHNGPSGNAVSIQSFNSTNTDNALQVLCSGPGVIANHSLGNAGNFFMNNTTGVGAGVRGEVNSIFGNNGTAGVYGVASGTGGYGGYFEHSNTTGFGIALQVINNGQGSAFVVNHTGSSGDLAIYQTGGFNVARIDRTGRGFFNGGTQTGGADVAEAFDVTGERAAYEPGDVMVIATDADRTVEKSTDAYSPLVIGVYATKPGVLMTEAAVDTLETAKIPLGVVGVIPTKVCNENGAIRRGDMLVTSHKKGYAMKADVDKVKPGQVIGKALQEFDGEEGKIKVYVNVK
ncbi:hypothetical protein [Chitinophaga sp. 212800010-3]|uniref:hypothetical protein n=1 Tax=unclassified Chitinophaga TaxID=2619133 RepID=UPI002DF4289F|nr:Collagen-like protein [Chitinophaga sp. 212800010-3]